MTDVQERRHTGTHRVAVSTLVEVCGSVPGIPVFEAESVDVSPRGMHLKTAYLPEAGAPVVCRFENDGGEIVVEGVVAWRREGSRGGEFGVKFTALDSRSVDALRDLCGFGERERPARPRDVGVGEPGARVRLHIDGLGSPMKARVKAGGSGRVQVGSNLEFLKVGRRLEIEDMEQGARRAAQIDGVSVIVDPSTQIPQLVVALRYEGAEDTTPSPTTASLTPKDPREPRGVRIPPESVTVSSSGAAASSKRQEAPRHQESASEATASEAAEDGEPALRGRVASLAANAEGHAKAAGEMLASASTTVARGAARWFKGAASKVLELKQKREVPLRRTTSPPPGAKADKPKLRSQSGSAPVAHDDERRARLSRRTGITTAIAIVGVVGIAVAALVLRSPTQAPPGAAAAAGSAMPHDALAVDGEQRHPSGVVTANVPLFGPTPLTTTEPAPLGPPPDTAFDEQSERAAAKAGLRTDADQDEDFEDSKPSRGASRDSDEAPTKQRESRAEPAKVRPEDVPPWGRGRMHLPTIHRLRLDGPGDAIQGAAEPTGFTIVVPGRKVMEAAAGIARRDDRIARVRATNTAAGAQVSFRFKDSVPGYRVRLRRDYIEFLVSAPPEPKKTEAKKTAATTKSR